MLSYSTNKPQEVSGPSLLSTVKIRSIDNEISQICPASLRCKRQQDYKECIGAFKANVSDMYKILWDDYEQSTEHLDFLEKFQSHISEIHKTSRSNRINKIKTSVYEAKEALQQILNSDSIAISLSDIQSNEVLNAVCRELSMKISKCVTDKLCKEDPTMPEIKTNNCGRWKILSRIAYLTLFGTKKELEEYKNSIEQDAHIQKFIGHMTTYHNEYMSCAYKYIRAVVYMFLTKCVVPANWTKKDQPYLNGLHKITGKAGNRNSKTVSLKQLFEPMTMFVVDYNLDAKKIEISPNIPMTTDNGEFISSKTNNNEIISPHSCLYYQNLFSNDHEVKIQDTNEQNSSSGMIIKDDVTHNPGSLGKFDLSDAFELLSTGTIGKGRNEVLGHDDTVIDPSAPILHGDPRGYTQLI